MTQVSMTLTFTTGHISEAISLTDFILGIMLQSNKVHSMTQVLMTLTKDLGLWSRSKVKVKFPPKWVKNQRTVHISEAISHHIYYHSFL